MVIRHRRWVDDSWLLKGIACVTTFTIAAIALVCSTSAAEPPVTFESPCECRDNHGKARWSVTMLRRSRDTNVGGAHRNNNEPKKGFWQWRARYVFTESA